jgi:hypothetical protein
LEGKGFRKERKKRRKRKAPHHSPPNLRSLCTENCMVVWVLVEHLCDGQ